MINPRTGAHMMDWTAEMQEKLRKKDAEIIKESGYTIPGKCAGCGVARSKKTRGCESCYHRHDQRKRTLMKKALKEG